MNEIQRWAFIEDLFKQMVEQCDAILRLLGEPKESQGQVTAFMSSTWTPKPIDYNLGNATLVPLGHDSYDVLHTADAPISDDEAKRLLEDAKEYLRQGA